MLGVLVMVISWRKNTPLYLFQAKILKAFDGNIVILKNNQAGFKASYLVPTSSKLVE